jgi:hypothetical protein
MAEKIEKLTDLTPDPFNANEGTLRGAQLLGVSMETYGAARGIVVDKHGLVIAGNKAFDAAVDNGLGVQVVPTDGKTLVVVQRTDLDADTPQAKELAYLDNRTSEVGLKWNPVQIEEDLANGLELGGMWSEGELQTLLVVLDERERVTTVLFDDRAQRTEWRRFLGTLPSRYPDPPGASIAHRLTQWIADQTKRLDAEDEAKKRQSWQAARAARQARGAGPTPPVTPEESS